MKIRLAAISMLVLAAAGGCWASSKSDENIVPLPSTGPSAIKKIDGKFGFVVLDHQCGLKQTSIPGYPPVNPVQGGEFCAVRAQVTNMDAAMSYTFAPYQQVAKAGAKTYRESRDPDLLDKSQPAYSPDGLHGTQTVTFVFAVDQGTKLTAVEVHGAPGTKGQLVALS